MRRREFQLTEGGSQKFWAIKVEGSRFFVQFGRIGTAGQTQSKKFDHPVYARKAADKLIAEKIKKGYVEVAPQPTPVKPKKAPAEVAAAAPLEVTHAIDLAPTDWYL